MASMIESMNRMPWKQRAIVGQVLIVCWVLNCLCWLSGCEATPTGGKVTKSASATEGYQVVEIDGCEYIEVSWMRGHQAGYYSLTHKGNCKNPIHKATP